MKLLGIEAARGIAALLVVTVHAMSLLADPNDFGYKVFGGLMAFGRAGVDFFFVLSGFIIAYVHARDLGRPASLSSFWRKRVLRIYPAYWVVTAIFGCILAVSPTADQAERDPWYIFTSLTLLPDHHQSPIVGVAWSLRHEMMFYGFFSLALLSKRLGFSVMGAWLALILLNMGWALATNHYLFTGLSGSLVFHVFNVQFFFGMAVAALVLRYPPCLPWPAFIAGTIIFFGNGMLESFVRPPMHEWPIRHLMYALGGGLAIYGLAVLDRARAMPVPKSLVTLGASSYSLYLTHVMVLIVVQQVFRAARPYLHTSIEIEYFAMLAIAVAAGVAFNKLIERPLLRVGNRTFIAERQAA